MHNMPAITANIQNIPLININSLNSHGVSSVVVYILIGRGRH